MPSRCRRKSSSKGILPKNRKIEYYRCPNCGLPGCIVTDNLFVVCGISRCGKSFRLIDHRVSEEDYEKIWGLSKNI